MWLTSHKVRWSHCSVICSSDAGDVLTLFESDNKKLDVVLVLSSKLGPNSCLQLKISTESVSVILFL